MVCYRNENLSNVILMFDTCLNASGYILLAMEGWEVHLIYKVKSSRGSGYTRKV